MTKRGVNVQHSMQGVFVFVLLGLFAMMATLIVLLGAQMYRGTVDHSEQNNAYRVLNAYVRSMIRAEDTLDSMSVEKHGDVTALAMKETIDNEAYVTWIYEYEGSLYELFTSLDEAFDPEDGTAICRANSFDAEITGSLVNVRMTDGDGEPCDVQVALRCAE